ncbi:MAG: RNA polymerase subunit sigma-70 [Planctomyces sp.]|nr:RNA polymerase subunit sigma-70 [Planctomyces sp.]
MPEPDDADWRMLHEMYHPLIRRWILRVPGMAGDAADIAQDVFVILMRELPTFERRRDGSFRAWLKQITLNRIRTHQRRTRRKATSGGDDLQEFLTHFADPSSQLSRRWDQEHDQHVLQKLMAIVQLDFGEKTWEAFQLFAVQGHPASEVASKTGLTLNALIKGKARILSRLREESRCFLE